MSNDCNPEEQTAQKLKDMLSTVELERQEALELVAIACAVKLPNEASIFALLHWKLSIDHGSAASLLLKNEMISAALVAGRTCLEHLFYAAALWKSPHLWEKMESAAMKRSVALLDIPLNSTRTSAKSRVILGNTRKTIHKTIQQKVIKPLDVKDWAKEADLVELHRWAYETISAVNVHGPGLGVMPYMQRIEHEWTLAPTPNLIPIYSDNDRLKVAALVASVLQEGSDRLRSHLSSLI